MTSSGRPNESNMDWLSPQRRLMTAVNRPRMCARVGVWSLLPRPTRPELDERQKCEKDD